MNTLIICATIVVCIFIICYYINRLTTKTIENESFLNSMSDDISSIKDIVDRTISIDIYNESVKHNLLTIKHIMSKYVEESEDANSSTKES